jgi:hypothetical protein
MGCRQWAHWSCYPCLIISPIRVPSGIWVGSVNHLTFVAKSPSFDFEITFVVVTDTALTSKYCKVDPRVGLETALFDGESTHRITWPISFFSLLSLFFYFMSHLYCSILFICRRCVRFSAAFLTYMNLSVPTRRSGIDYEANVIPYPFYSSPSCSLSSRTHARTNHCAYNML